MVKTLPTQKAAWEAAATVKDPEIPVLSIEDLGILREVLVDGACVSVTITPTYSGCPAMDTIAQDLTSVLSRLGFDDVKVQLTLSPAWSTDWISDEGRRKLTEYGIAAPQPRSDHGPIPVALSVPCPRCHSLETREISRFASTSCKALYECRACLEPFDYFKVLT